MTEYIAKRSVLEAVEKRSTQNGTEPGFHSEVADLLMQDVKEMPALDVVPVVHGEWIDTIDDDGIRRQHCSRCDHMRCGRAKINYCPHCGAKMDVSRNCPEQCQKNEREGEA